MTPTTMTLELARGDLINANDRPHYMARSRLTKALRQRAVIAWRAAGSPKYDRAKLDVTITTPRAGDVSNWQPTLKALVDGMTHPAKGVRGILPDDSDAYLVGPHAYWGGRTPGYRFTFAWSELPS